MSSKKYRNKQCAYCGERSTGPDHVVARKFFLPGDRDDLPQVPACDVCNRQKSALETELLALLPFGERHQSAQRNLQEMVPSRLEKNRRLHRRLGQGQGRIWAEHGGLLVPTMTLPVAGGQLINLFKWITRGLLWFHWRVRLTHDHELTVLTLTKAGEEIFDRQFALNAANRAQQDLKNGTFWYEGAQAGDDPAVTIWRFSIFGGVQFGDPDVPGEVASRIASWSCNSYYGFGFGHYVNSGNFRLVGQGFRGSMPGYIAISTRRRDGSSMDGGYKHGEFKFSLPLQVSIRDEASIDERFLGALDAAQVAGAVTIDRLRTALPFIELATRTMNL